MHLSPTICIGWLYNFDAFLSVYMVTFLVFTVVCFVPDNQW